jgi:hypothetical protein
MIGGGDYSQAFCRFYSYIQNAISRYQEKGEANKKKKELSQFLIRSCLGRGRN